MKALLSIFTPSYNRANELNRLFASLKKQIDQRFEWIIVDDGSSDETKDLVQKFQFETVPFKIKYYYQENQGKHLAINQGLNLAQGEYFAIVDSDDYLAPEASQKIIAGFCEIRELSDFAGIAFAKADYRGNLIGKTFQGDYVDARSTERNNYQILGDKFEVFYTDVLRDFPFPSFPLEKFMPEIVVWTRIANSGLNLRWYQDLIYFANYQEDGLSSQRIEIAKRNPRAYALMIKEQIKYANLTLGARLGYLSFYCLIRKEKVNLFTLAKEIEQNPFLIGFAFLLRKIKRLITRTVES